jgi:hypothetical protein
MVVAPTTYGWNRTFKNYTQLATELLKSGTNDLCWYNWSEDSQGTADGDYVPFIPNDVSITLNTQMNKFRMTGNNVNLPPTFLEYSAGYEYALNDRVYYDGVSWRSLQANNLNHAPIAPPSDWWVQDYNDVMAVWDSSTNYGLGRYVTDGTNIYISTYPNATQNPNLDYTWSATQTYSQFQVVLETLDGQLYTYINPTPKVGAINRPFAGGSNWTLTVWSSANFYVEGFITKQDDIFYVALVTNNNLSPSENPTTWQPIAFWTQINGGDASTIWNRYLITGYADPNVSTAQGSEFEYEWDASYLYETGTVVNYQGNPYEAVTQNIGTPPLDAWVATKTYDVGDTVLAGVVAPQYYQSIQNNNTNHSPPASTSWWVPIRRVWKNTTDAPVTAGLNFSHRCMI